MKDDSTGFLISAIFVMFVIILAILVIFSARELDTERQLICEWLGYDNYLYDTNSGTLLCLRESGDAQSAESLMKACRSQ